MAGYFIDNKLFLSLETGTITTSDTPPDQHLIDLMALPLRDLVKAFNALPTIKTLPTGVKNHWHFTVRRAYLDRPDDILHLVNPADGFTHMVGPRELRGLSEEEKVAVVVRLLLECFVHGMPRWLSTEINGVTIPHHEQEQATSSTVGRDVNNNNISNNNATNQVRYAPWTWGTQDTELARAVEERMKDIGVGHKRLTKVATGNARDELASMRSLVGFHECLIQDMTKVIVKGLCKCTHHASPNPAEEGGSSSRCDRCGRLLDIESIASAAVRIKQRQTAGVEQSENLSIGRPREANVDTNAIANQTQDNVEPDDDDATIYNPYPENDYQNPLDFYNSMPHTLPEACDLADNIGLNLPQGDGGPTSQGILHPIRRLIITGADTPTNLVLLLGPRWGETAQQLYDDQRLVALLCPAVGSPNYAYYRRFDRLDRVAPYKRPRLPSAAERVKLSAIYTMQHVVKAELKNERREPSPAEMIAVCSRFAGPRWEEELDMSVWQLAVNSLDQGVQLPVDE